MKYACELCGYIYDETAGDARNGIVPGTSFSELPDYFECPSCGYEKEAFSPVQLLKTNQFKFQSRARISVRK